VLNGAQRFFLVRTYQKPPEITKAFEHVEHKFFFALYIAFLLCLKYSIHLQEYLAILQGN